ncbi:MAG: hemagglutinin repeat-containing protein [Aquabacterium sp.]|jgi:filamentous hemagglutinin family protein|nr:hemagglutinin repeat-containing protein [Aquabacterium sp.]
MNRIYRIVKNKKTGLWMVASETARSTGAGGSASAVVVAAVACAMSGASGAVWAQTSPSVVVKPGQAADAYVAPNGRTTVVNINAPSSQGLSHNTYTTYNVNGGGLILNNAAVTTGLTVQTSLAGQLLTNGNLTKSATTILNEVVGTERSLLNGFTEVAGNQAAVVVANPNGITCSGCGFINTNYATLTTGVPTVSGGMLTGLTVTRGDIAIVGAGINTQGVAGQSGNDAVPLLNLFSRTLTVDGPINAKQLEVRAGAQAYTLDGSFNVTGSSAVTGEGAVPTWTIDAGALGGMYADSIRLVSSEVGAGVRMRNDVATNIGDFQLTANGQIRLLGKITAARDAMVTTPATSTADPSTGVLTDAALNMENSALTATRDLTVNAAGQMWMSGGQLYAGRDATLTLGSLKDRSSTDPQQGNNQRFAVRNLTADVTGLADIAETNWAVKQDLQIEAGAITATVAGTQFGAGDDLTLRSRTGDIDLGKAQVQTVDVLTIDSHQSLTVGNGDGQGIQSTNGSMDITAGVAFTNTGSIQAKNQGSVHSGTIDNSGNIILSTERTQSSNDTVTTTGNVVNQTTGKILSAGKVVYNLGSGDLTNHGLLQSTGGTQITARNFIQTDTGAKTLAATSSTASDTDLASSLTLTQDLTNRALVQAGYDLTIVARTIKQNITSAAVLGSMSGTGATNVTLSAAYNDGGGNIATVFSGNDLSITAPSMVNNTTGLWGANHDLNLTATTGNIVNYGALYAGHDITATATSGQIQNYITYHTVTDQLLGNRNGAPDKDSGRSTAGNLYSTKQVLDTTATVNAGHDITFTADTVINSSQINAGHDITVTANTILNQVQGGDTRVWSGADMSGASNSTSSSSQGLDYNLDVGGPGSYYSFPDKYESTTYTETWHRSQYFSGGTPILKPELKAVGTITLQDFTTGKNLGGVIEGNQVNITTTRSGATFVNDALTLSREDYTRVTSHDVHYIALGPLTYSDDWSGPTTSKSASAVNFWPTSAPASDNVGASIRAVGSVNISGVSLQNNGPVLTGHASAPGTPSTRSVSGTAASAFPGLTLTLPSNPNGYFVTSRDPASRYLVESNPLFTSAGSSIDSDFLAGKIGVDINTTQKRLGDGSYEAYLVKQQLIEQTGSSMLNGQANAADVYKNLMENAADQAKDLGLAYGSPLSPDQIANLKENIVWMVEVEVEGQKVLAPVVYLAPSTLASIDKGAVIAADKVTMDVTDMMNAGGTIAGKDSVTIASKGDITNLSGNIKGGDVSLTSTEGSIKNETFAQTSGDVGNMQTTIGKTAGITATGNLALDAKNDIVNRGAQMAAGGDATLVAGNNITFDTIEDKTSTRSTRLISEGAAVGTETTTTSTTTQIKSGLTVGGNLTAQAKNDITFAGTDVNVGGDAKVDAGKNFNVIARENTVTTDSKSQMAGMGVGGGLYGTTETTTNSFSSRNVGSSFNVGGNADLTAGQTMTVQGSNVNVGGDTSITATDVKVLAGKDVDRTTSTTKTTSFLQIENVGDGAKSDSYSGSSSGSESGTSKGAQASAGGGDASASASVSGSASAGASAGAGASHSDSAGVTLAKTTTTTESSLSQRSVGSQLNLGGNVKINAKNNVTLQGSELNAGGDVDLNAKSVDLLAAQNIEQHSFSSTTTRLGLYATTENKADASASASAQAGGQAGANADASRSGQSAGANASAEGSASAQANAQASASSNNTVDVLRIDTKESESLKVTNTGSAIRSGGNMKINVEDKLRTVGSTIEAEGDIDLKAKDMSFEAAQDIDYSKESTSTSRLGLYLDAGANAQANAQANASAKAEGSAGAKGLGAGASGSVNAEAGASAGASTEAKIGVGIQAKDTRSTTEQGSSTAVTSAIISKGGSITRTAEGTIRDVGTNIEAAGDFNQSANRIESLAAENSQFSRTTNEETTARIGVYASAGAEAEAKAHASASAEGSAGTGSPKGEAKAEAGASASAGAEAVVGLEVSMERNVSSESSRSTQAVVSNIKAGGNVNSQSKEKTVLQGTNIDAGGDVNLSASELEVQAARNTEETSSSSESISARMATKFGVGASADASAKASSEDGASANAEAGAGIKMGIEAEAGYGKENSNEKSTTAVTSNISGNKIKINTTGKTTLEGTNLNAGQGGVDITADSLDFKAAKDTFEKSSDSLAVNASMKVEATVGVGADIDAKANASTNVASASSSGTNAVVGSINSAGGLNINTKGDTRLEGTQAKVAGDTNITAGGDVKIDAARNSFQSTSKSVDVSAGFDKDEGSANLNVGVNHASEQGSQAVVSNLASGGSLNITAGRNMTIEGANIEAGRDAQLAAGGNIDVKEARNEYTSNSVSVNVGLGHSSGEEENQLKSKQTKTESSKTEGSLGVGVGHSSSSEAVTGSIKAGNNLTVASGGNTTFVGTDLAAGNSAQVVAGGDVNFKAAESTSTDVSLGLELSGSKGKSTTRALSDEDKTGEAETSKTKEASGSLEFGVGSSNQQKGSTVQAGAGGIQVASGGNVNLQGTQMQTDGSADISAAGKVNKTSATSSSVGFGFGVSGSTSTKETTGSVPEPKADDHAADTKADAGKGDAADKKADHASDSKSEAKSDVKADDKSADAKHAEGEDGKAEGKADEGPEIEKENGGKLSSLTFSASADSTKTDIQAAGGTTVRSGVKPSSPIPGVSMTLRGSVQTDGSLKASVPVPGNVPAGKEVKAVQPDGSPLPDWVQFDAKTGSLSGQPPADYTGGLNIVVNVPQADGSTKKIGVQF